MVGCVSSSRPRWRALCAFSRIGSEVRTADLTMRAQPLLLLGGGVDLDREVAHHPVGAILDRGRIERLAPERPCLPRRAEALTERAGDEGRHSDGGDDEEGENDRGVRVAAATGDRRAGTGTPTGWEAVMVCSFDCMPGGHCPTAAP